MTTALERKTSVMISVLSLLEALNSLTVVCGSASLIPSAMVSAIRLVEFHMVS